MCGGRGRGMWVWRKGSHHVVNCWGAVVIRAELARASCQIVHGKSCHRLAPVLPSIPIHRPLLALRRVALPLHFAVRIEISAWFPFAAHKLRALRENVFPVAFLCCFAWNPALAVVPLSFTHSLFRCPCLSVPPRRYTNSCLHLWNLNANGRISNTEN